MQTFLPYADFDRSAKVLDRQRLGKQRLEAKQILRALLGLTKGWARHPAALMWSGHEKALADYGAAVCAEWKTRGYVDNLAPNIAELRESFGPESSSAPPPWFGDEAFHRAHRANLRRKDPTIYGPHLGPEWDVDPTLPYIYPAPTRAKEAA